MGHTQIELDEAMTAFNRAIAKAKGAVAEAQHGLTAASADLVIGRSARVCDDLRGVIGELHGGLAATFEALRQMYILNELET